MAVTQRPLHNGRVTNSDARRRELERLRQEREHRQRRSGPHEAAFISGEWVDAAGIWGQRILGVILLGVTFVGTAGAANDLQGDGLPVLFNIFREGGLTAVWGALDGWAKIALMVQVILTGTEWFKRHEYRSTEYRVALGFDVVLTFFGWLPVVVPPLQAAIDAKASGLGIIAYGLLAYVSYQVAKLPERILIKL